MTRFEPLGACDVDGCDVLVESHVARCQEHRAKLGRATEGRPGVVPDPVQPASPPDRGDGEPSPSKQALVPCCGPYGFHDCPDGALVEHQGKRKRCSGCQSVLDRRRAKRADPASGPLPERLRQAQDQRERERARRVKR